MAILIGVLLVATSNLFEFSLKWTIVAAFIAAAAFVLTRLFLLDEESAFLTETWWLTKKIFPLLVVGTFITGIIGYFMPAETAHDLFGTNSFLACFIASVIGALLYMPTLLEVPMWARSSATVLASLLQARRFRYLLAGPSLSLPSMIVITRVIGLKKGGVYISLVS